ncbi:Tfp pilus assembly protein FimT/FimU [Oleiagrimonas citrea]|uniref:Type II secretion system protein H n=1 Tax=Oleiagrimonas citrea TaxID=1665687 RepID=A0A846ZJT8_9GAMM|nr:GspH/FimT family pseudopilin [Oleiagrimonas citrea]NKZ38072.1 prepilin-type N-terminal cleavage/methylation domain-containing protein [Oleiagrimonas citrea]
MPGNKRKSRGFTLIEQIAALGIFAVLIGVAVPSMQGLLHRNQAHVAMDALSRALHATRMLAIERQRHVLLCPSADGRRCSGGHQWQHGWVIALDRDNDGQPDGDVFSSQASLPGVRILGGRNRTHVRYHADGSAPGSNLTLVICPTGDIGSTVDALVVSNVGRIRSGHVPAARCRR